MQKTELKFNSQLCTTKEQSQRLLELGLKPETADCYNREEEYGFSNWIGKPSLTTDIPAWSMHRLMEICSENYYIFNINVHKRDLYGFIISTFEHLKKQGKINKEYSQ